ncbi:pentapeptide repeat-containing protein [Dactylosporangium sp. CA-233914]|uniref:pentapeptide repeat-containing protein n=1 Tax=Dactylosporangium sp. CA-233914 TaxID=3239934 RepID=UPI003D89FBBC
MPTRRSTTPARQRPGGRAVQPHPPRIREALQAATLNEHDLEPDASFEALVFADIDLTGRRAVAVEFEECQFTAARFAGSHLDRLRLTDCRIETSDWSNLRAEAAGIDRVAFATSRLTGMACTNGRLRNTAFRDCKLDLSSWRFTHFDAVTFDECNLTGADFTNADLRGASFTRCRLTAAQFSNADMHGARFRACELDGIGGIASWSGAVVHRDDLIELADALAGALSIVIEGGGE